MLGVVKQVAASGNKAAASGKRVVKRKGPAIRLSASGSYLELTHNKSGYVVEESNEIAEQFGIPCRGCTARFEMSADDPGMELFNDYVIINQRLQKLGKFVIFDPQECKLLFEEERPKPPKKKKKKATKKAKKKPAKKKKK